jgi:hypothetical protein
VVEVGLNFDALKFNWVIAIVIYTVPENHNFMISGINLGHLGADLPRITGVMMTIFNQRP